MTEREGQQGTAAPGGTGGPPPPPPGPDSDRQASGSPTLPPTTSVPPRPPEPPVAEHQPSTRMYRSDYERRRSLQRRANPWYWQIARAVVGLAIVAVVGAGLYFGAQKLRDYLASDDLPAIDADAPEMRRVSFLLTADNERLHVLGTLTVDGDTGAFEFFGRAGTDQEGLHIVSPDGRRLYIDDGTGWRSAESDPTAASVVSALPYLVELQSPGDVIGGVLRERYLELDERTTEGNGSDSLTVWTFTVDAPRFAAGSPVQWGAFNDDVVPGLRGDEPFTLTIAADGNDAVTRLAVPSAGWEWERIGYSDESFAPIDPAGVQTTTDG